MKMSFKQFLKEAPLPDDWDHAIYNPRIPFAQRIKYATARATKIGSGSSRVAFKLPYQGRSTVLKIAKNKKGMAQNEHEAQMLTDYYLKRLNIVIPIIDYDEQSQSPTWIHTEFANKAKPSDFKKQCGGELKDLISYALKVTGKDGPAWGNSEKINEYSDLAQEFVDIIGSYDLPIADFGRVANWGIYEGRLVIIDIGLSYDVYEEHYS